MQAVIPLPEGPAARQTCAWCQEPADGTLTTRKARYRTNHHGQKTVAKPALEAPACRHHMKSVQVDEGKL